MSDSDGTTSSLSDDDFFPISNPELAHAEVAQVPSAEDEAINLVVTTNSGSAQIVAQHAQRSNIPFQPLHSQPLQGNDGENSEGEDSMSVVSRALRRRSRGYMLLNETQQHDGDGQPAPSLPQAYHDFLDIVDLPDVAALLPHRSPLLMTRRRRPTRNRMFSYHEAISLRRSEVSHDSPNAPDNYSSFSDLSESDSLGSFIVSDDSLPPSENSSYSSATTTEEVLDATLQADQIPTESPPDSPQNLSTVQHTPEQVIAESSSAGGIVTPPSNVINTQSDFVQQNECADRISNMKRKLSPPKGLESKKPALQTTTEDEEESLNCPICFEPWSNCGNHRLTSLKCGHIFGQKCIERWLKDCYQKCPQCNAKAKRNDIRIIYAKKLQAIDTTDLERALREADTERCGRRECEMELAKVRMQYHMAMEECNRLKSRVSALHLQLVSDQSPHLSPLQTVLTSSSSSSCRQYHFLKSNVICQSGGCRIMDFHSRTQQFVVSQPSPHASFMNGFGVKKVSGSDFKGGYFTMLHQKAIKDLRFSHLTDHHLLSASQDGSLRITDLMSNAKIHDYKLGKPVWSCCWDRTDRNVVYAGLCNGSLMQFDLRNTSGPLSSMENLNSRCPIVSLYHVPPTASDNFQGRGGLFTGTLEGASFWQDMGSQENSGPALISDFKPTLLPLEPGSCTGLQYCRDTQHCLVTYRPGRSYRSTTHILCELQCRRSVDDAAQTVTCNIVDTYTGGQSHKMLARNSMFVLPDSSGSTSSREKVLQVCVGDEAHRKVHIYDPSRSCGTQSLCSDDGPALDITPIHMESTPPMLAILSQSTLKVFRYG